VNRSRAPLAIAEILLLPAALLVVILGAWEAGLFHALLRVEAYTLAYPSQIGAALGAESTVLVAHGWVTIREVVLGYLLGSTIGFLAAIAANRWTSVRSLVTGLASGMNASPIIALAPLTILYFGGGMESKVALVTLMTIGPMAVMAAKGFRAVEPDARAVMQTYAATPWDVFRKVELPTALPFMFTALKLNVSLAWIGAIVGEFVASDGGIGQRMMQALSLFNQPAAWAAILVCAVGGIGGYLLISAVERRVIPWHSSVRVGA
jgi:NitT/TauT family transport system permease protein